MLRVRKVALFAGLLTITVGLMPALGPLIAGRTFAPSNPTMSASTPGLALVPCMGAIDEMKGEQGRRTVQPAART